MDFQWHLPTDGHFREIWCVLFALTDARPALRGGGILTVCYAILYHPVLEYIISYTIRYYNSYKLIVNSRGGVLAGGPREVVVVGLHDAIE